MAMYHDKIEVSMPTDDDFTTQLIERNRHLNALLQNTVETLEKERHLNAATKNRVPGGYYMMSRAAEKKSAVLTTRKSRRCASLFCLA
ncbi:hypothetical protein AGG97_36100 [Klebsiella michiganensis]|nr:hypothetical protein AGG97_36100 [Klebsiella michiganensis]